MFKSNRFLSIVVAIAASIYAPVSAANPNIDLHHFDYQALGSSLRISIEASKQQAESAEKAALAQVLQLEKIFSSYDSQSEVSRFNRGELKTGLSKELASLIRICEQWRNELPKAFSCRLGKVIDAWRAASDSQVRPKREVFRDLAKSAIYADFSTSDMDLKNQADFSQAFTWNFGAIAKGYILDEALKTARLTAPDAKSIGIDIGGDGVYWRVQNATQDWQIKLAMPDMVDDSQTNFLGLHHVKQGAIAYSGHSIRGTKIGRRHYSHILVPRDGWPAELGNTSIVSANSALEADVVATSLAAMEISEALDWVNSKPGIEALIVDKKNRLFASNAWYKRFSEREEDKVTNVAGLEAKISFTLKTAEKGNARKPYVALWLEDEDRKVVNTLLLLGQSERWMVNNKRWWQKHGKSEASLLEGFARPTRRAGNYDVFWNGRDQYGQLLAAGSYTLNIEVVREHGSREKLKLAFDTNQAVNPQSKRGRLEIDEFSIDFTNQLSSRLATSSIVLSPP